MRTADILVVGAGPVGLALALSLHRNGHPVALVDARTPQALADDNRVLALSHGSVQSLKRLNVWPIAHSTPIRQIHVSQEGGFGRTRITAEDYGLEALGQVVGANRLGQALQREAERCGLAVAYRTRLAGLTETPDALCATLVGEEDGTARHHTSRARLVACAEGGIDTGRGQSALVERDYRQHALISLVRPTRPHGHLAWERFTAHGPIALLPHGNDYAVVHTTAPGTADTLMALDDSAYLAALQAHFGSRVGLAHCTARARWPLGLRYRQEPTAFRRVWLGNAAQTLHPVAGQGFNLALRDVCTLAELIGPPHRDADPGSAALLKRYGERRWLDRRSTIGLTDGLVRLFSQTAPGLRTLRGLGLFGLDLFPPARHFLAKRMLFGARAWP